jgi:hypothetical protein
MPTNNTPLRVSTRTVISLVMARAALMVRPAPMIVIMTLQGRSVAVLVDRILVAEAKAVKGVRISPTLTAGEPQLPQLPPLLVVRLNRKLRLPPLKQRRQRPTRIIARAEATHSRLEERELLLVLLKLRIALNKRNLPVPKVSWLPILPRSRRPISLPLVGSLLATLRCCRRSNY